MSIITIYSCLPREFNIKTVKTMSHNIFAQTLPSGWDIEWIICSYDDETMISLERLARKEPRIEIIEAQEDLSINKNNCVTYAQGDIIRPLDYGDTLLIGALERDILTLNNDEIMFSVSVALDKNSDTLTKSNNDLKTNTVNKGYFLDEWIKDNVVLGVHPLTVACRRKDFWRIGGYTAIEWGLETLLLVKINELGEGLYHHEPSLHIDINVDSWPGHERPVDYKIKRQNIGSALLLNRENIISKIHRDKLTKEEYFTISNSAWETRYDPIPLKPHDTDSLYEIVLSARKLHFLFAWDQLYDYTLQAVQDYPEDSYLKILHYSGIIGSQSYDDKLRIWEDYYNLFDPNDSKMLQLYLTQVTFTNPPVSVIEHAINTAQRLLTLDAINDTDRAISAYRIVGFYRMLEQEDNKIKALSKANSILAQVSISPELKDHLSERMVIEKAA